MSFITSLRCRRKKVLELTNTPVEDNSYNGYLNIDLGLHDEEELPENPVTDPEDNG